MNCINCGKPLAEGEGAYVIVGFLCTACDEASARYTDMLKEGIELEYSDGTKEILVDH